MQIDPAALSRNDSASTAIASSKSTAPSAPATHKSTKALISVPRLDLEPIYTELKAAIGDNWAEYKESTTLFLLGMPYQPRESITYLGTYHISYSISEPHHRVFLARTIKSKRACIAHRLHHMRRSEDRAPSQQFRMRNSRKPFSRPPRSWCCQLGVGKRQAVRRVEADFRGCGRAETKDGGYAATTQRPSADQINTGGTTLYTLNSESRHSSDSRIYSSGTRARSPPMSWRNISGRNRSSCQVKSQPAQVA